MESQYTEMGRRIKLRRKELKIKQSEMAEALNVSNNHISSIETGKQKPSLDIFISICEYLNVTPDYLLLGALHSYNVPLDILDKLRLCSQEDIELTKNFVELLVTETLQATLHFIPPQKNNQNLLFFVVLRITFAKYYISRYNVKKIRGIPKCEF